MDFRDACEKGRLDVIKDKVANGYFDSHEFTLGLHNAAKFGHTDVVRWFLEDGRASPREPGALLHASVNGHYDVVKLILEYVDVEIGDVMLESAVARYDFDLLKLLFENGRVKGVMKGTTFHRMIQARNDDDFGQFILGSPGLTDNNVIKGRRQYDYYSLVVPGSFTSTPQARKYHFMNISRLVELEHHIVNRARVLKQGGLSEDIIVPILIDSEDENVRRGFALYRDGGDYTTNLEIAEKQLYEWVRSQT